MPRTLCPRVPWVDHLSDRELRDEAETTHWVQTRAWFNWTGFWIKRLPSSIQETISDYEEQAKLRTMRLPPMVLDSDGTRNPTVDQLNAEALRSFCFKDCMIYAVSDCLDNEWWLLDLYARIYRRWYPSRAQDIDINYQNFFCQLASFYSAKEDESMLSKLIGQITAFHKLLCQNVEQRVAGLPDPRPIVLKDLDPSNSVMLPPSPNYELRPTFGKCFLIFHDNGSDSKSHHAHPRWGCMKDTGAIVVWLDAEDAVEHSDEMTALVGDGIPEQVRAYQCKTLECAIQSILLTTSDPDRTSPKKEWHGHWQELLDQSKTDYSAMCQHCWEYKWWPKELQLVKYSPPLYMRNHDRA